KKGHLEAKTNPIRARKDRKARLALEDFGLSETDLNTQFYAGALIHLGKATLKDIIAQLKYIYCGPIGIQYTYMNQQDQYEWCKKRYEELMNTNFNTEERKRILYKLNYGVIFEKFLSTKFIGQKRFGLEGGENMIPALD